MIINVDVGFDATKGSGSMGAVVKDSTGGFIAASHNYNPHVVDVAMTKAAALRDGLLLAQQINSIVGTTDQFQSYGVQVRLYESHHNNAWGRFFGHDNRDNV